jgi:hypothetical protein
MRTPKDQCLFLTVFVSVCVPVILATWFFMPVYHRGEYWEGEEVEQESRVSVNLVLSPEKILKKGKEAILTGEAALVQLKAEEEEKKEEEKDPEKTEEKKAAPQ